jgi:PHD/YefM family antitoxin component YafN of YafNO toxin-antitoxin module
MHRATAKRPTASLVRTIRETRERIPAFLEQVRRGQKPPIEIFGKHRRPEGVMLSYQAYIELLEELDDLAIAATVHERDRSRKVDYVDLEEIMRALEIDADESAS